MVPSAATTCPRPAPWWTLRLTGQARACAYAHPLLNVKPVGSAGDCLVGGAGERVCARAMGVAGTTDRGDEECGKETHQILQMELKTAVV
jgi:hypothetical protein